MVRQEERESARTVVEQRAARAQTILQECIAWSDRMWARDAESERSEPQVVMEDDWIQMQNAVRYAIQVLEGKEEERKGTKQ